MANVIAMILAGGEGSRLMTLSNRRAKPAVPFGSNFRIIDFTMTNVMQSGIRYLGVLTQYKPYSLMAHIGMGEAWGFSGRSAVAKILPPYYGGQDSDWYAGTADAIYQNMSFIARFNADAVLVLSGDHIYNMNYTDLLEAHFRKDADVTLATQPVPWEETDRFGIVKCDKSKRIEAFQEKPKDNPISNQGNLGIYVFKRSLLEKRLRDDAANSDSTHDFGTDIIPGMLRECDCYAYEFPNYWRDVGTLQSYWEANMECLNPASGLDLHRWHVQTNYLNDPPEYGAPLCVSEGGKVMNSILGRGSYVRGSVINSIIFRGVEIGPGAVIRDSIIMDGSRIGAGAKITKVITDKNVEIGAGAVVGSESDELRPNDRYPKHLATGLTLIGKLSKIPPEMHIGSNCLIYPDRAHEHFTSARLESGQTLD